MPLTAPRFRLNPRLQAAALNAPAMHQGERGDAVGAIQVALRDLGQKLPVSFAEVFPDGIYGPETVAQVRVFQTNQGLSADGIAGKETLARLDDLFRGEPTGALPPFPQTDLSRLLFLAPPGPISPPDVAPFPLAQPGLPRPSRPSFQRTSFAVAGPVTAPATPSVLIGKRAINNCGNATLDDFKAFDFPKPKLNFAQQLSLDFLRTRSDADLESLWRATFKNLYFTGALGQSMIDRFMKATGGVMTHAVGTDLSTVAKVTQTFKDSNSAAKGEIEKQLTAQFTASGDVDVSRVSIIVNIPFSTFSKDVSIPPKFRAMIGGIHGITLFATSFTKDLTARTYSMDLLYRICDNFGVGNDDLYTPDLQAMWLLQHERAGHTPFVNSIEIEETISGSF